MQPCKLTIKGLNSFSEEQVIDFNKLSQCGLFGIVGPTGSGKSTILDAITMALYGKISRESKQYINASSNSMSISFEFKTNGTSNYYYICERSVKRKKNGEKGSPSARLIKISDDTTDVIADNATSVNAAVEKILGLNYDDFSRTVVLPQGKFSDFLKLAGQDRRDMLERIFNLEVYGKALNEKILFEKNTVKNNLLEIKAKLMVYGEVSADLLKGLKEDVDASNASVLALKNNLDLKNTEFNLKKQSFEFYKELESYRKKLKELDSLKDSIELKRLKLSNAEKVNSIIPAINNLDKIIESINKNNFSLNHLNLQYTDIITKLKACNDKVLAALRLKDEQYPLLLQKETKLNEALKLSSELKIFKDELNQLRESFKDARAAVEKYNLLEKTLTDKRTGLIAELDTINRHIEEITIDFEMREKANNDYDVEKKYLDLKKQYDKFLKSTEKEKKKIKSKLDLKTREAEDINVKHNASSKKLESKRYLLEEIRLQIKHLEINNMSELLAKSLEENVPCPVCGSTIHPKLVNISSNKKFEMSSAVKIINDELNALLDDEKIILSDIETLTKDIQNITISKASISKDIELLDSNLSSLTSNTFDRLDEFNELYSGFCDICNYWKLDSVSSIVDKFKKFDCEKIELDKKEKKLRKGVDDITSEIESNQKNIAQCQLELDSLLIRGNEKGELVKREEGKIAELSEGSEPLSALKSVKKEITNIEKKIEKAKSELDVLQTRKDSIEREKSSLESSIKTLEEQQISHQNNIDLFLVENGIATKEDVRLMFMSNMQQKVLQNELKQFDEVYLDACSNIKRLEERLTGDIITNEQLKLLSKEISGLNKQIEDETKKNAVLCERIVKMENDITEVEKLKNTEDTLNKKAGLLEEISKLVGGNRFVEFISKSQLNYIAREASKRLLEITYGRFALEVDGVDFIIRDDHNGGIRRSPNTLSGGEVFLTSFSLALALSSKIQMKSSAPLEFFFLDEGFGTLDNSLIDTVMNSLERLRLQNMSVGLITHIEELKNRLPIKLIVKPQIQGVCGTTVSIE